MTANPIDDYIPKDIQDLYEIHNYRNAAQVLATGCAAEFKELLEGLRSFRLTLADIRKPGGNESDIPKRISGLLRDKGWRETRIKGDLLITQVSGAGIIDLCINNVTTQRKNEGRSDCRMQPRSFSGEERMPSMERRTSSINSSTSLGQLLASSRLARDQTPSSGFSSGA